MGSSNPEIALSIKHSHLINNRNRVIRFLSNPKVKESILIGRLQEQCKKAVDSKKVLVICDSSVVSLNSQM